jgi:hypothetical protein
MKTTISGIPCEIEVISIDWGEQAVIHGPADNWYPGSAPDAEYRVLDRNGRPAPWLERKMTEKDHERILEEILGEYDDRSSQEWYDFDSDY